MIRASYHPNTNTVTNCVIHRCKMYCPFRDLFFALLMNWIAFRSSRMVALCSALEEENKAIFRNRRRGRRRQWRAGRHGVLRGEQTAERQTRRRGSQFTLNFGFLLFIVRHSFTCTQRLHSWRDWYSVSANKQTSQGQFASLLSYGEYTKSCYALV